MTCATVSCKTNLKIKYKQFIAVIESILIIKWTVFYINGFSGIFITKINYFSDSYDNLFERTTRALRCSISKMAAVLQDHDSKIQNENDENREDPNDVDDAEDELSSKDPAQKKKKRKKKKKGA